MRGRGTFRLSDLTRAIKAARAGGVDVRRIRITQDGAIEIDTGTPETDDDLDRELAEFERRNAHRT